MTIYIRLYDAQRAVEHLMPEPYRQHMNQMAGIQDDTALVHWLHGLINLVLEQASVLPPKHDFDQERAICPLCGGKPFAPYPTNGFVYPEGLTRHLEGRSANECLVMKVLREWAQDRMQLWDTSGRK